MSEGFFNLKDTDGDGRISASEFTASRDKDNSVYGLAPRVTSEGISLMCADPELRSRYNAIEKGRFDLINSDHPLTAADLLDNARETAALYKDILTRL